jgi:hypothetical protein
MRNAYTQLASAQKKREKKNLNLLMEIVRKDFVRMLSAWQNNSMLKNCISIANLLHFVVALLALENVLEVKRTNTFISAIVGV